MHVSDAYVHEFRGGNSVKGGGGGGGGRECKTREKFNFSEKGKMVILVENRKFSRFRITKWTALLNLSRKI